MRPDRRTCLAFGLAALVPAKVAGADCDVAASRNLAAVHRYASAWKARSLDALLEPFAPDAVFEDLGVEEVFSGHEGLSKLFADTLAAYPDFRIEMLSAVADAKRGGSEWVMSGTHRGDFPGLPATGKFFRVRAASVLRFSEGRIVYQCDYWSMAQLMRQLNGTAGN